VTPLLAQMQASHVEMAAGVGPYLRPRLLGLSVTINLRFKVLNYGFKT